MTLLEEVLFTEAERLGREGFTVTLDRPLLELAKELMRPSSLVMVGIVRNPGHQAGKEEHDPLSQGRRQLETGKVRSSGLGTRD